MAPRGAHKVSKSCAGHVPNLGDMLFWTSLWGKSRHVFMIFHMMSCLKLSNNSDSCIVIWAHIVIQHTKNSRQMDWIHQVPLTGQDSSRKASSRAFNIRCTRAEVKCSLKGVGANGEPGRNSINSAQTSEMLKWCAVHVDLMFQTSDSSVCQRTCHASCKFRNAVAGSLSDKATIHDDKEPTKERKYTKGPKIISKQKCTGFCQFSTCSFSWKTFLTSFLPQPPVLPNCMIGCTASIYIRIQHASDKLENPEDKESVLCEHKSAPQCTTSCQVAIKVRHQQPASIVIYSHI